MENKKEAVREAKMPGHGGRKPGAAPKGMKLNWGTAKRLFAYIAGENKALFAVVLVCIFLSTIANVAGSLFLQILIDQYIEPLLLEASPVFDGLVRAILTMAGIYVIGVCSTISFITGLWQASPRVSRSGSVTICSPTCRLCRCATLTPIPLAMS